MMRLQGMNPAEFNLAVTEGQLGRQLGNTMSVNVLERLLVRVLPAAKLARKRDVTDRWENGQAIKALSRTRGKQFRSVVSKPKGKRLKQVQNPRPEARSKQVERPRPEARSPSPSRVGRRRVAST